MVRLKRRNSPATQEALVSYVPPLIYFLVPLIYSWLKSPFSLIPVTFRFMDIPLCSSSPALLNVSQSFSTFCFFMEALWKLCMCYFGFSNALLRGQATQDLSDTDRNFGVCVFKVYHDVQICKNCKQLKTDTLIIPYFSCDQNMMSFCTVFHL